MVKHIVMWKLKEEALGKSKGHNAEKIKELLEALDNDIDGLLNIEVGVNICDSDQSFDVVLYSEFENQKSLDDYQKHPKHLEVGAFIVEVREDRVVVDYEC